MRIVDDRDYDGNDNEERVRTNEAMLTRRMITNG